MRRGRLWRRFFQDRVGLTYMIEQAFAIKFDRENLQKLNQINKVLFQGDEPDSDQKVEAVFSNLRATFECNEIITKKTVSRAIEEASESVRLKTLQSQDRLASGRMMIGSYVATPSQEKALISLSTNYAIL